MNRCILLRTYLNEETDGSQRVGSEIAEAELLYEGWSVGVESTLRPGYHIQSVALFADCRTCTEPHPLLHSVIVRCIHILQLLNCIDD